ncbi:(d)CMP kinase [Frankia sp. AiPs1]|uniref:(d)CMP kinase n=1 Tax=Frankia sp. AiPs1 TaxID=573493 RepID=UPI002043B2C9|nr:(d)CMP kinase [Frankia sp. AiPs1]MCM3923734.1 (d)CMP kinase [Frankia sp. AiPs1]
MANGGADSDVGVSPAVEIAQWVAGRRARAGETRVLAVDGRSGAGKSTLAQAIAERLDAPVVRMDDLYDGWDGLAAGVDQLVARILRPLARGERACWRRYDWHQGRYGSRQTLEPATAVLVVEGVGAGARAAAPLLSGLVCVAAPLPVRRRRALARDGDTFAAHWDRWARHEDRYFADEDVAGRADLLVNGAPAGDASATRRAASGR